MLTNPTTSTYRPGRRGDDTRPGMDGRRGDQARELRAILASRRRDIRSWARDARMIGADGNSGVLIALTTRTVDGVLQGEPVFGPTESRTPRGLAADHLRRIMHFDIAADRIISTTNLAEYHYEAPSQQRERSYSEAYRQERRCRFAEMIAAEVVA